MRSMALATTVALLVALQVAQGQYATQPDDDYGKDYRYSSSKAGPLEKLKSDLEIKSMLSKAGAESNKMEKDMEASLKRMEHKQKVAEKQAAKKKQEEEKKEEVPLEVYHAAAYAPALVFANASCTGTPYCFRQWLDPVYAPAKVGCPSGYSSSTDSYGVKECVKTLVTCMPEREVVNGKCCTTCPEGSTRKGNTCISGPEVTCFYSKKPCPDDCTSQKFCDPKDVFKLNCKYQCCRSQRPTYPIICTDPQTYVDSVALRTTCTAGKYDKAVGKCVVATGGWGGCPAGYRTCVCAKDVEAFCTVPSIYGMDACELFCGGLACKDKKKGATKKGNELPMPLKRVPCPAIRGKGY